MPSELVCCFFCEFSLSVGRAVGGLGDVDVLRRRRPVVEKENKKKEETRRKEREKQKREPPIEEEGQSVELPV